MDFELPELDRKATKTKVEAHLEKYRLFKYLTFEEREASITASAEERFHGPTNQTSDQTSSIAVHNVDEQEKRKYFCLRTERAVKHLPPMERFLIEARYMSEDSEYISDLTVYCHRFQPSITHPTYNKIRWKAFYRLALNLNIAVTKQSE
ncbi:ArpU family phage packaging/lysis transcriptional regulator [Neobacillus niacini]|uniref:ArpU family phage packaging/lysis transcriptional regulator n=1 Tax=Neobacillus niacini TaxID=86668 RepID=UPI003B586812